jgi:hypothetical protein
VGINSHELPECGFRFAVSMNWVIMRQRGDDEMVYLHRVCDGVVEAMANSSLPILVFQVGTQARSRCVYRLGADGVVRRLSRSTASRAA